jgi:hypothetical protein
LNSINRTFKAQWVIACKSVVIDGHRFTVGYGAFFFSKGNAIKIIEAKANDSAYNIYYRYIYYLLKWAFVKANH